jgi:hypothetical protein
LDRRDTEDSPSWKRRQILINTVIATVLSQPAFAETSVVKPAKRPLAYRVDSTIPPTLLALDTLGKQRNVLVNLGKGLGTDKEQIVVDTLNLNNMLNKAVFGTMRALSPTSTTTASDASFVCFGVPSETASADLTLVQSLLTTLLQGRPSRAAIALGLASLPYSTQPALDSYVAGQEEQLVAALTNAGVQPSSIELYLPLIKFAKSQSLDLLALSPEFRDLEAVQKQGLSAAGERRAQYVVDPQGFIALSGDPRFQVYTDRSLFKDVTGNAANFFAQRILAHEAAATAVATYAMARPDSLVALVAPTPDVRFLQGINGRIPRLCRFLKPDSTVTNNAVTTILCNPTAAETVSATRRLRLEIGTGPETLEYQTKIADYLWFSTMPKVNLIPRLMDY